MWERWDCYSRVNGFQDRTMNSESHYAFGAVEGWFIRDIAGIRNDKKCGYSEFVLAPKFAKGLKDIKVNYLSDYGLIRSELHLDDEGNPLSYDCEVPPNTRATLFLPGLLGKKKEKVETIKLGSGTYHFEK